MKSPLKIIIFDGSYKTTPFINRLIKGLAVRHEVYVLGFNVEIPYKLDKVHYIPLGSNQNKFRFVATSLRYAANSKSWKRLINTIGKLNSGERNSVQQQNLDFVLNKINPDIIHLQWPSVIPWIEEILVKQKYAVLLSQRGSQNNVRPFVEDEFFKYLQEWYPKINGFHSVSKAISLNGDKIWASDEKLDKVIYTGVPIPKLVFLERYDISIPLQLLSVGRAHWVKGYSYALSTCQILKEKKFSFQYTIIGGAGDEELQFLISDLGLQECVNLTKRMSQEEVFKKMNNASLLLMPSVEEGIPNVAVEAMALGLPVLSTDCGGIAELILDGEEGWIVPIRDPEAMAEAIVEFSNLPLNRINEVRKAAREKVEKHHSEERMVREMEELYYKVLELKSVSASAI